MIFWFSFDVYGKYPTRIYDLNLYFFSPVSGKLSSTIQRLFRRKSEKSLELRIATAVLDFWKRNFSVDYLVSDQVRALARAVLF
jgi:hypothetical protein